MTCQPYDILVPFNLISIDKMEPGRSGVYGFWFNRGCIYIGKALNIKDRLGQHWRGSHNDELRDWVRAKKSKLSFNYKFQVDGVDIDSMERFFIRRFEPRCNRIIYINSEIQSWQCE